MKNNIGFFTHMTDAYENGKFLLLRAYYGGEKGWAMEAKFWALNCKIGLADDCKLDLSRKDKQAEIAKALDLSLADLEEFLKVLSEKEYEINLIHRDSGVIWTDQTQDDLGRAMSVRIEARNRRNGKVPRQSGDNPEKSADISKKSADEFHGEERRGEERSREEEEEGNSPLPPAPVDDLTEAEKVDLYAFTLKRLMARKNRPDDPPRMAKKIMLEPDILEEWRKGKAEAEAKKANHIPMLKTCPLCGKPIASGKCNNVIGWAQCEDCGELYWDKSLKSWELEDIPQGQAG